MLGRAPSALDPVATLKEEEPIDELHRAPKIVIVTDNLLQATRARNAVAVMHDAGLVEHWPTTAISTNCEDGATDREISGECG